MIDGGTDKSEEFTEILVWQAIKLYPTKSIYQFLNDKSPSVRSAAIASLGHLEANDQKKHRHQSSQR